MDGGIRANSGRNNGACRVDEHHWLSKAKGIACLVKDATIVRRDIMSVEKEPFLYCEDLAVLLGAWTLSNLW